MPTPRPPPPDRDLQKAALKEALKEWLDEQFAMFGRWTFYSALAAGFAGLVYLGLRSQGWSK